MLERQCNSTQTLQKTCRRQVNSADGGPVRGSKHIHGKMWEGVRCHTSSSDVNQGIGLQKITPGWSVFFSNWHQWLGTSLRGSAQILQQREQRCAILGYISLSVLQYAIYRNANCPLRLHPCMCTAEELIFFFSKCGTLFGLIRKQTQTNPTIWFYIESDTILSQTLKIASTLCVQYDENAFDSHAKYLSSLRFLTMTHQHRPTDAVCSQLM